MAPRVVSLMKYSKAKLLSQLQLRQHRRLLCFLFFPSQFVFNGELTSCLWVGISEISVSCKVA